MTKRIALIFSMFFVTTLVFGAPAPRNSGFYVSLQGGWGDSSREGYIRRYNDAGALFALGKAEDAGGIAGRFSLGYGFNSYFGAEVGAMEWTDQRYNLYYLNGLLYESGTLRIDGADALLTAHYPFHNGYRVFVKAGGAYVNERHRYKDFIPVASGLLYPVSMRSRHNVFRPEAVAGLAYDFNEHWAVNMSYSNIFIKNEIQHHETLTSQLGLASVGITYHVA